MVRDHQVLDGGRGPSAIEGDAPGQVARYRTARREPQPLVQPSKALDGILHGEILDGLVESAHRVHPAAAGSRPSRTLRALPSNVNPTGPRGRACAGKVSGKEARTTHVPESQTD